MKKTLLILLATPLIASAHLPQEEKDIITHTEDCPEFNPTKQCYIHNAHEYVPYMYIHSPGCPCRYHKYERDREVFTKEPLERC